MADYRFEFPAPLAPLFDLEYQPDGTLTKLPYRRYKVAYGGRGSGKSWTFARGLVLRLRQRRTRALCLRFVQNSIDESVHTLIEEQIAEMDMKKFFDVKSKAIFARNGSYVSYAGLWKGVDAIKSKEGVDIAWVEEAHPVTKTAWDKLIPTIRKPLSEIWVSLNPELETDETYKRFILHPGDNVSLMKVNWRDNPWFPEVLYQDMLRDRERDYDAYLNIWEGQCKQFLEGAVYGNEMRAAALAGRITRVPYDPTRPVHFIFDLGWHDLVAIWMVQAVGFEYHVIDYWQGNKTTVSQIAKIIQERGYVEGTFWLPHDAASGNLASSGKTVQTLFTDLGKKVRTITRGPVSNGIAVARTIFPKCWFDEEKCSDGLQSLRRYRYEVDPETGGFSREPLHDPYSHGADAFRYFALSTTIPDDAPPPLALHPPTPALNLSTSAARRTGWMRK